MLLPEYEAPNTMTLPSVRLDLNRKSTKNLAVSERA